MLISWTIVIISLCMHISDYQLVHLKCVPKNKIVEVFVVVLVADDIL